MFSRLGLRFQMAVSYVVVSAAAVLIVEAVLLAIFVPRIQSAKASVRRAEQSAAQANSKNAQSKVTTLAAEGAGSASTASALAAASQPGRSDRDLLIYAADHGFDSRTEPESGPGGDTADPSDPTARVLAASDGRVVWSQAAGGAYPVGSKLPADVLGPSARSGVAKVGGRPANWATYPVRITGSSGSRVIGVVYTRLPGANRLQVSSPAHDPDESPAAGGSQVFDSGSVLWLPAMVVLLLLIPVGGLFGLFSTRRLIVRIRRLAAGTSAMAKGDLRSRIPVSGTDEVGRLENSFNVMAERLEAAVEAERDAAGATARRAERTRIARELHDSISQDLFSVTAVAGGLCKALPSGSELRRQTESMERTLERTMREMRAMLLELRPVALEDAGLTAVLTELCRAYEARLGIRISADLGALRLTPPVEHAVLRVVQEALGNAVRHGRPEHIELSVGDGAGRVTVLVHDDGHGFDQERLGERHGMGLALMRERIAELGGEVEVSSAPEQGTTVRVLIPDGAR